MKTVPRASQPYAALAVLGLAGLCLVACSDGTVSNNPNGAAGNPGQTGGGSSNANAGAGTGGGTGMPVDLSKGGPRLRVLTQAEYKNSITDLVGAISTPLTLPPDTYAAGYTSIGAAQVAINASSVEPYETASLAITEEVFADTARWQKLVGCASPPMADLSDACIVTFIQNFGKRAFRRDLAETEVQQWLKIGKDAAALPGSSPAKALAAVVSGFLQSPYFLYRVEINKLDASNGRLKYDGTSMATRLAFLLTGRPPSSALLMAAASGQLDTPEGVRAAATPMLADAGAIESTAAFFNEFSQVDLVMGSPKSPELFASFNEALQNSMLQATKLFIKNIVLAPGADVRSLFDSDQTFVDANLAPIYGVPAPGSGFMQIKLAADAGRAGILGQAAVIAGHSPSDHTSPTRRGVFISETFLCTKPPDPPAGVITTLPVDPTKTTRQQLDLHRTQESCKACHALFDPLGFGLEHLDPIGKYRATENGLTIDATGTLDGVAFDGGAQMGAAFRQSPRTMACLMSNFYRSSTARSDAAPDAAEIEKLSQALTAKGYVWRDLLAEFVVSDAFRSAPAVPVTAVKQ